MKISQIVACSENDCIGVNNDLPWHLPNDLKYFKKRTTNHCIIMGRKTFESIGKALPNRENIILTRNTDYAQEGCRVFHGLDEAIHYCESKAFDEVFFIGGAEIFKTSLGFCDTLYLTRVHTEIEECSVSFPEIDWSHWLKTDNEEHEADEKNAFRHTFETWERKEV